MAGGDEEKAELDLHRRDGIVIVMPLMKEITFKNSRDFLRQMKAISDREGAHIVINLEKVEIIDSVSLGTLVAIKKYAKRQSREVSIANLSFMIFELFRLLNFTAVFSIHDTVDDAVAALEGAQ